MTRHNIFFYVLLSASAFLTGCTEEEKLTPSLPEVNLFEPNPDLNDAETMLRKDFYDKNGVYIIFQDTLRGKDHNGNELIEVIDFSYGLNDSDGRTYRCTLYEDIDEQKTAAETVEKFILSHIKVSGGKFCPYSVLPVKTVEYLYYGSWRPVSIISNWRCMIISCDEIINQPTVEEQEKTARTDLHDLISSNLSYFDSALDPFHDVTAEYNDAYISEFFPEWEDNQDMTILYECGYISYYEDWYGDPAYDQFSSQNNDFKAFLKAVMIEDEAEFRATYGEYDRIILKYELLRNVIAEMGYKF